MPIEEKERVLEFSYVEGDVRYDVIYDPRAQYALNITGGNGDVRQSFVCPVDFFKEVVEFLQGKAILKPTVSVRTPFAENPMVPTNLSLPVIQKTEENQARPPVDQISSFDIDPIKKAAQSKKEISIPEGPVVSTDSTGETINRQVLRTRVDDSDPQSAEKEAASIRGKGKKGEQKTIKRAAPKEE
jgi:hypothetical protein